MEQFIWQNKSWPHFFWNPQSIIYPLADLYKKQGLLEGLLKTADLKKIKEIALNCITLEIANSYKLDNIEINQQALKGIIAKKIDLEYKMPSIPHKEITSLETIVSVFFDIIQTCKNPLTIENLVFWNKELSSAFNSSYSTEDENKLKLNDFRIEEYNYVKEDKVYYTAPAPKSLPEEMKIFINWFNKTDSFQELDNILKSSIAQFYLIALRPFDKTNNILARMISYRILYTQNSYEPQNKININNFNIIPSYLYAITEQTVKSQKEYNYMLTQMATGNLDMTIWISWYIRNSLQAINNVIKNLEQLPTAPSPAISRTQSTKAPKTKETTKKHSENISEKPSENISEKPKPQKKQQKSDSPKKSEKLLLNKRQEEALEYLKTSKDNKISTSEYSKLFKCSQDTAARDLEKLIKGDFIEKGSGGGRSTFYSIKNHLQ